MDFCSKVAIKLLVKGIEEDEKKNILTSPLSYNALMNIAATGSSNDTLVQILQFLEYENIKEVNSNSSKLAEITSKQTRRAIKRKVDDARIASLMETTKDTSDEGNGDGPTISFLNGVWVNNKYRLKNSFQELVEDLYKAKVRNIDYKKPETVAREVNEWASASTKGLIKEVLQKEHITENTILILENSLYFKGSWESEFKKSRTLDDWFYLLNGEKIKVPFMTGCKEYSHIFFEDCQVARIPYRDEVNVNRELAMYIFLPYEKDGLQSLLNNVNFNHEFFNEHCDPLEGSTVDRFYIPKFKFSFLTEQGPDVMINMGLTLPFDNKNAEFYEMIEEEEDALITDERLHVSKIIQKAFIEVNEEGTEAAALSRFDLARGAGCASNRHREIPEFRADHPFMFIIREEKSGVLFFVGTVLNPQED